MNRIADRIGINRIVLALSVARLADGIGNSILFILIPLYVARLPAPWFPFPETVRVGILIALYGLVNTVLQPVMGALGDRLGRRKPLIQLGLVVMAISTLSYVWASRFVDLLALRAFQGVGLALTVPASLALLATSSDQRTRGGSMGVFSTMRIMGFALGPLIGGYTQVHYGFNTAFYVGTACILLAIILVQLWVCEPRNAGTTSPASAPPFRLFEPSLLSAGIVGAGAATFVMASNFSMMTTLENEFNARLQQTALGFGIAFSALMISRFILQVPLGRLSDRIGRKPLIIGGLILLAPATILLGEVTSMLQLTGVRVLQGVASAGIAAPAFALAADIASTESAGRQMSIISMGFGLGIALGPLIAGFLAVYAFELPFLIGGVLSLLAAWYIWFAVPETVQREPKPAPVPVRSEMKVDDRG